MSNMDSRRQLSEEWWARYIQKDQGDSFPKLKKVTSH